MTSMAPGGPVPGSTVPGSPVPGSPVPGSTGAGPAGLASAPADPAAPAGAGVRHFTRDDDLSPAEQAEVLDLAARLKADRFAARPLAGPRAVAVLFDKPSLRTRTSFSVGVAELGGYPLVIDTQTTHAGRGEAVQDVARVLASQVAAIAWRTFSQDQLEAMAAASSVPVINALTDDFHPCQVLADLQTIQAAFGQLTGVTLAFLGDGSSNMAHSYLLGGVTAGLHVRICAPEGYWPAASVLARAAAIGERTGGSAAVSSRSARRLQGGGRARDGCVDLDGPGRAGRRAHRRDGRVQPRLRETGAGQPGCRVLHCLPAHRGEEIAAEVIDGPASLVFEQAENRLHAQKALLCFLLERSR